MEKEKKRAGNPRRTTSHLLKVRTAAERNRTCQPHTGKEKKRFCNSSGFIRFNCSPTLATTPSATAPLAREQQSQPVALDMIPQQFMKVRNDSEGTCARTDLVYVHPPPEQKRALSQPQKVKVVPFTGPPYYLLSSFSRPYLIFSKRSPRSSTNRVHPRFSPPPHRATPTPSRPRPSPRMSHTFPAARGIS